MKTTNSHRFANLIGSALCKTEWGPEQEELHPRGKGGLWVRAEEDVAPVAHHSTDFIPPHVHDIADRISKAGGRALIVGGSVRDRITGKEAKDIDLEIYGVHPDKLEAILKEVGRVDAVGKAFGVLKLRIGDKDIDVSIPRRENKVGQGHRGFLAIPDPSMSITEAARRRDFTMNSMAMDPKTGAIYDPFGGMKDLQNKVIRHTDATTFVEDPLRVLRAAQFAARFGMQVHPDTIALCQSIKGTLKELPKERIGEEWKKLLMKSDKPSIGLDVLDQTGALEVLHPEMHKLKGVPQDPRWHPEGDVWIHTKMVLDEAVRISKDLPEDDRISVVYAALLHDIAKPQTTEIQPDGRITAHGHEAAGGPVSRKILLDQLNMDHDSAAKMVKLVENHLAPKSLHNQWDKIGDAAIRRLAGRMTPSNITALAALGRADSWGRTTPAALAKESPEEDWLLERARTLKVNIEAPKPILMGRHLMERGVPPGPKMGEALRRVFELQLDGKVNNLEEALAVAGLK